jgi:hypothetical protein
MSESENNGPAIDIEKLKKIMDDDLELIHDCFTDFLYDWSSQNLRILKLLPKTRMQQD